MVKCEIPYYKAIILRKVYIFLALAIIYTGITVLGFTIWGQY